VPGRVVLVATSPRVPPGLLSWPAWQALRSARVSTGSARHPQLPFLRDAGVEVAVVERPAAPQPLRVGYGGAAEPGDVALAAQLHERARAGEPVVWLTAGEDDAGLVRALGDLAARDTSVEVEVVYGSYDPPGARLLDVVAVMDRLRSPGGCPWDAEQTHASLAPYLLEEAYEAYAALEDGDLVGLREELGDVLLQVVFHARLAEELAEPWSVNDVAGDLVAKLVRRHPHVFAGGAADDLEGSWDAIKAQEKGGRASVTDGVPLSQPALSLAAKLQKRAGKLGAPVTAGTGLGGELWELVRRCREQGVDPEVALRATARAFRDRLAQLEAELRRDGVDAAGLAPEQWAERWG
jgi:XTP/dITP diphosphohydrolase